MGTMTNTSAAAAALAASVVVAVDRSERRRGPPRLCGWMHWHQRTTASDDDGGGGDDQTNTYSHHTEVRARARCARSHPPCLVHGAGRALQPPRQARRPRRPSTKRTTWTGLSGRRNSAAGLSSDCDDDNERRRGEKRGAHSHTQPKYAVHFRSRRVRSSSARPAWDFCMRHDFELSICHSSYVIICHSKEIYFHVR